MLAIVQVLLLFMSTSIADRATDDFGRGIATTAAAEVLEETTLVDVRGTLPSWLSGDFLKQSASQYESGQYHLTHSFDGYAKLLRWRFHKNNTVTFRSKFLRSNFFNVSKNTQRVCPTRLLGSTKPLQSELPALTNNCSDNFNVNVFQYNDEIVALADFEGGMTIDLDDLTSQKHKWTDTWATGMDKISAAHPGKSPDGTVVNFVMRINPLAIAGVGDHTLIVYKLDGKTDQTRTVLQKIKIKRMSYVHSFTVTQNYVIIAAAPLTWELAKVMVAQPILSALKWVKDDPTIIYVMRLDGTGGVTEYTVASFFAFHHANGYETDDRIVFDVIANNMDSGKVPVAGLTVANLLNASTRNDLLANSELRRYTLTAPMSDGGHNRYVGVVNVTRFSLTDANGANSEVVELPTVNPNVKGLKHCFVYMWAPHLADNTSFGHLGLIKKNLCIADHVPVQTWQVDNHFPSEPIFVPKPNSVDEDDGVVLTVVWDGNEAKNYLAVIDGQTMETLAMLYCTGDWKHVMSFGIHGRFFNR